MPTRLNPIPSPLLQHLGSVSNLTSLEQFLKEQKWPVPALRQSRNTDAYPVSIPGRGLDLMLQCINPQAPEEERQWGLQSITLHTAKSEAGNDWQGDWPNGLDAPTATAGDVVSLLAEDNDNAVLLTDGMACFEIPGFDERRWLVTCLFDPDSKTLLTFSLIRSGEWAQP